MFILNGWVLRVAALFCLSVVLAGCSLFYYSPGVQQEVTETTEVRVVPITPQSIALANSTPYTPRKLPSVFNEVADVPEIAGMGIETIAPYTPRQRPRSIPTRLPPQEVPAPYRIGVGDVIVLATPDSQSLVYQVNGLLASQSIRQGLSVQNDGAIAIPTVGRVNISDLTLAEAQNELFNRFVENQIEPSFSMEVAEFRSQKVSVDGAVRQPKVVPITSTPLYLDEAITTAGGISSAATEYVSVKLYRDGKTYQIPADNLFTKQDGPKVVLKGGDRVYVDDEYQLGLADEYMDQQIKLTEFLRSSLNEERSNFKSKLNLNALERDYVYRFGEVRNQGRFALPFEIEASLADVLFDDGGFNQISADIRRIYVLRQDPYGPKKETVTAWSLNVQNAPKLIMATQFMMRPNDIVFVATKPITDWNRVISQLLPSFTAYGTLNDLFID